MTPIPGSAYLCRGISCLRFVVVGHDAVPASKVTGSKRSRGFYCTECAQKLGVKP
jgi:hypothetical protein